MADPKLTHLDEQGNARMVDVGEKPATAREAVAEGAIRMQPQTLALILGGGIKKGDVLTVAKVAAVQAAKRTAELIPMCHPIPIVGVEADFAPDGDLPGLRLRVRVRASGPTGVEMEALTAVSVGLLTVYDMAKAAEKGMQIASVRLLSKRGGQSGAWRAEGA